MPFISASAISPYNSIRGGAEGGLVPVSLLLDLYPDALVAYDLRKLSSAYTGNCIEVRRGSDNAIQDIGFVDGVLDAASLVTFAQGGECYVRTLYDQSGNGNNATQTVLINQPQITDSLGAVITKYGKPSIYWYGPANADASVLIFTEISPHTVFIAQQLDVQGGAYQQWLLGGSNNDYVSSSSSNVSTGRQYIGAAGNIASVRLGSNYMNGELKEFVQAEPNFIRRDTEFNLISMVHDSNASRLPLASTIAQRIGLTLQSALTGWRQSTIIYGTDQSANRVGIERNINSFYNMYWDGSETGLLDDYPSAAAAYSLRALNSAYTGALVRVRRSNNNEKDIFARYDGSLDTTDLLEFVNDGVNTGDGFVTTWYDQSGQGNDAVQASASSQPQIVSLGVLNETDTKPSIAFNQNALVAGTDAIVQDGLAAFAVATTDAFNRYVPYAKAKAGATPNRWGKYSQSFICVDSAETSRVLTYNPSSDFGVNRITTQEIKNDPNALHKVFENGALFAAASTTSDPIGSNSFNLVIGVYNDSSGGGSSTTYNHLGNISELVFYGTDQSANRVAIETNINNHYTIY